MKRMRKVELVVFIVLISSAGFMWSLRNKTRNRLLCFVPADSKRIASSMAVKETWGSRCDALLFFSKKNIAQLPSVVLPDSVDGYYRLWGKVRGIWKHLRRRHLHDFDWFLKADDDTYVVVDNLRTLLDRQSTAGGVWLGARLKNVKVTSGYHSGGAGYVLSRRALQLFDDGRNCSQMDFGYEDLEMGRCLEKVGVQVVDTTDSNNLPTFLPFSPEELFSPQNALGNRDSWYWKTIWSPHQLGRNCCSPHVISFHHIKPKMMYAMDFLIYSLKLSD